MDASENDDSDPLKTFKANFDLVMTHKQRNGLGEPTTYYFRLRSKPTPREENPTWFEVTVDEGEYEGAISNWALETSEFLDIPGNRFQEANFIKKVIRLWHESHEDRDFGDNHLPQQMKLIVKSPMVFKVGNHLIFVSGENCLLKFDENTGLASQTTPNEMKVLVKYCGEKVTFSVDGDGNQIRVFGSSNHDENRTFTCDLRAAAIHMFEVVDLLNRCRAKEDHGSILAFLLMASRTKLFDIIDQNQKLGIIQSSAKNTCKSLLLKLVGYIFDGKEPKLVTGFTKYNIRTDLAKRWNIWLVDEPMPTDPFDDLIKTNWSKSEGKIGNCKENTDTTRRSSAIVAVNATVTELAKDYKMAPQTMSKAEFLHVGENKVEHVNPNNFRTDLNACTKSAILLHPHSACLLAAAAFVCKNKVTEEEMKNLSPFCDGDERMTESVALFHRWWHFWLNVALEYNLDIPAILKGPFDPRCFTYYKKELFNLEPRNLSDLVELILSKPEADEVVRKKGKKGPPGFVLKITKVEECQWFEPWMSSKYKRLPPVHEWDHGKHVRQKLISKGDVNLRAWEQLEAFDALTVATLCSEDRAQAEEKNLYLSETLIQNLMSGGEELLDTEAMVNGILDTSFHNSDLDQSDVDDHEDSGNGTEDTEELDAGTFGPNGDDQTGLHGDLDKIMDNHDEDDHYAFKSFFTDLLQQNEMQTNLDHEHFFKDDESDLDSTAESQSSHGSNDLRGLYVRPRDQNLSQNDDTSQQGDLSETDERDIDLMENVSGIIYGNIGHEVADVDGDIAENDTSQQGVLSETDDPDIDSMENVNAIIYGNIGQGHEVADVDGDVAENDTSQQGVLSETDEQDIDSMENINAIIYGNIGLRHEVDDVDGDVAENVGGNTNGRDATEKASVNQDEAAERKGPITRQRGLKRKKLDDDLNNSSLETFKCDVPMCTDTVFKNEASLKRHRLMSNLHKQLVSSP